MENRSQSNDREIPTGSAPAPAVAADFPWETTPLGPRASWPAALREAVDAHVPPSASATAPTGTMDFRALADTSPATLWITDASGRCTFLSRRWADLTGQPPQDGLRSGWLDAVLPEDRARVAEVFERATARREQYSSEFRVRRRDGRVIWVLDAGCPRFAADGAFDGFVGCVTEITALKDAESALRENEAKLNNALAAADFGVWQLDLTTGRIWRSLGHDRIFGYETLQPEWTIQRSLSHVLEDDREWAMATLQPIARGEKPCRFECRVRRVDGQVRWVAVAGQLEYGPDAHPVSLLGWIQDITERKRVEEMLRQRVAALHASEEALKETQMRLALAQAAGRAGLFDWDVRHDRIMWSAELEMLFGLPPGGFQGGIAEWQKLQVPEDARRVLGDLRRAFAAHRREIAYDFRAARPDGKRLWLAARARIDYDEHGAPVRVIGVNIDITDRREMELALREAEEHSRLALRAGEIGTWVRFPLTGERVWDARCKELFGLPADCPVDAAVMDAIHPDDRARVRAAIDLALDPNGAGDYEIEYRVFRFNDGQERWIRSVGRATFQVVDGQRRAVRFTGIALDNTELVLARATLEQRSAELEATVSERTARLRENVAELEAFSYSISHDMRAPLRSMQGYARILLHDFGPSLPPEARHHLQRISAAADRMDRLIQDVLNFSRVVGAELTLEPVDADRLVHGIAESYPNLLPPHAEITIEGTLPVVLGNEAALTQCFANLLGNAVKFVAPGTLPRIRVRAEIHGDRTRIFVHDNGVGIPPQAHAYIFGLFQRLDKRNDGTGVGLAIVKQAAQRMGGQVGLDSVPGHGSTFWLDLPLPPNHEP